jgi:hypothetical protein
MQKIKVNSSKYENRFEKRSFNFSRSQQNLTDTLNCLMCEFPIQITLRWQWIVCRSKYFSVLVGNNRGCFLNTLAFDIYRLRFE